MLLSSTLALALLVTPAQDAPATTAPELPQVDAGAPELPSDPEQAALEVIGRARRRLYDIRAAGLESLSFSVPIRMGSPRGDTILLGDVTVNWETSADPQVAVTVAETLPAELAQQSEAIAYQLEGQGRQILRFIDNDIFSNLLRGYTANQVVQEGALVHVHFTPKPEQGDAPALDWFFDESGVPVRFHMVVAQGEMSMDISYEHTWQPISETDDSLVLRQLDIVQEMGSMRHVITTQLQHDTIDGLTVLVAYTESGLAPDGAAMSNDVQLEGLSLTTRSDR